MNSRLVVDNRVFLLGLDDLYRSAMKRNEGCELLRCAREVALTLHVKPANVPVEGYYAEDARLTEYFGLLRALQEEPNSRVAAVERLPAYQRLYEVTSSPLFGRPSNEDKLLPVGHDPLSRALLKLRPDWTIPTLTRAAYEAARAMDDYSLVGLAARIQDPVVLAALRESVVLYAQVMTLGMAPPDEPPTLERRVDAEPASQANRFIDAFHALFPQGRRLPAATAENAATYWGACDQRAIVGRCVRVGYDDTRTAMPYHWAINGSQGLEAEEFWAPEIWTTERYRQARAYQRPVQGARLEGLDGPHDLNL